LSNLLLCGTVLYLGEMNAGLPGAVDTASIVAGKNDLRIRWNDLRMVRTANGHEEELML
jgi:hypothetical protein